MLRYNHHHAVCSRCSDDAFNRFRRRWRPYHRQELPRSGMFLLVVNIILCSRHVMDPSSILLIMSPSCFRSRPARRSPVHLGSLMTSNPGRSDLCHPPVGHQTRTRTEHSTRTRGLNYRRVGENGKPAGRSPPFYLYLKLCPPPLLSLPAFSPTLFTFSFSRLASRPHWWLRALTIAVLAGAAPSVFHRRSPPCRVSLCVCPLLLAMI